MTLVGLLEDLGCGVTKDKFGNIDYDKTLTEAEMACIKNKLEKYIDNNDISRENFYQLVLDEVNDSPFEWYKERIIIDLEDGKDIDCSKNIINMLICILNDWGIYFASLNLSINGPKFP